MSNILSTIDDDYEYYELVCKQLNIKPRMLHSQPSFYKHMEEIEKSDEYLKWKSKND